MNYFKFVITIFLLLPGAVLSTYASDIKTVAFAQDTMANDFRKAQVFEVRDEIKKHPELKFVYSDAQGQTSLLIRQIRKFIEMKVDLIIVGSNDEEAVVPVITKAYDANIPVIVLDRGIKSKKYTTFINSDNVKIGAIGAEYIAKKLKGKGVVLLFEGLEKADVTKLRSKGFLDEISKYKDIKVIKRRGNYLRKDSILEMEKLIKGSIHFDAIFSQSDSMLSGVRSVMMRYKIDPASVISVGCDYTSEAQEAIRAGTQSASVLFPLGGTMSVSVAIKILSKESVKKHIFLPVKLVTRTNVEDVRPIF